MKEYIPSIPGASQTAALLAAIRAEVRVMSKHASGLLQHTPLLNAEANE